MADLFYQSFREYLGDATVDLDTDTFKMQLHTATHVPSAANDSVLADLDNEVASGNGYTTGGATMANVTWTKAGATVTFDCDNPSWNNATFTARYAIIVDQNTAVVTKPLVCCYDFGDNKTVTSGTFTVNVNASGLFTLT